MRRFLLGLASALTVAGCVFAGPTPPTPLPTQPPPLAVRIQTADGTAGLARVGSRLQLLLTGSQGDLYQVTEKPDSPGQLTVHLSAMGGEAGREINSFVFGNAPAGATSVALTLDGAISAVGNGLYLIALPQEDVNPDHLVWTFTRSDGSVAATGRGIKE